MLKKLLVISLVILLFNSTDVFATVNKRKVFNKLDKQEQLSMLRSMRSDEMSQINSQIKDIKSSIKSIESSKDIPLNTRQSKLLKLNQELTQLTKRKADLEDMYKAKINAVKSK